MTRVTKCVYMSEFHELLSISILMKVGVKFLSHYYKFSVSPRVHPKFEPRQPRVQMRIN